MTHRHEARDEVAGALWHLALGGLYLVCVAFHLTSAYFHWKDSNLPTRGEGSL